MATMYGSGKGRAMTNAGSYYRTSPYTYRGDCYLTPRSTWSKVSVDKASNTTLKFGSAILILSVLLVLIAVMAIGGLALWMGGTLRMLLAFRADSKNVIVGFSCSFRITKGEKYNPMLKLNTSMVFREKERKYKNIFELLFRRSVLGSSYKQTTIDKFENDALKVFFRLYLDRRKIPRSITNVEDTIKDIIVKETYSMSSLFKNMEIDLRTVSVKRINQEGAVTQKQEQQQKHAMITKNGLLRSNRNSSLVTIPKQKTKHPIRTDPAEPNIDFSNIPTIQGVYTATKVNVTGENERTAELTTEESSSETTVIQERTTAFVKNEAPDLKELLPTNEPSTASAKRTVVGLSDRATSDRQAAGVIKTTSPESTASSFDTFQDFRPDPDFETSPWRPIVSGYINTQFKLFPHDGVKEKDDRAKAESSTRKTASSISDNPKLVLARTTIGTDSSRPDEMTNIFDTGETFPQDRTTPDLTPSGPSDAYDNKNPDIEVAGQLPLEMYSVKLKANHNNDNRIASTSETTSINVTIEDNVLLRRGLNATREVGGKLGNLSTTESDSNGSRRNDKIVDKTPINGIGVAEPVPDSEVELEAKGRYGETLRNNKDKEILRDRKGNGSRRQPVYTSYSTSDLNGSGSLASSLIPATTKPFRHTIPVDKVTSVANHSDDVSLRNSSASWSLLDGVPYRNAAESSAFQDETVTPSERAIREKISVTENNEATPLNYEQSTSTELNPARTNSNKLKYVSRNSTFIEIGIVKRMPNDSEESSETYAADNGITKEDEALKKLYNDTLKAYVIENSVAPVRRDTGIGSRSSPRPRPKVRYSPVDETTLLEQLFQVRNYTHEDDTINTDKSAQQFSSYEIRLEPTRSNKIQREESKQSKL